MQITLMLQLPRDELSIPLVRHICRQTLRDARVAPECCSDIEVALSEACTNALRHSGPGEEYEVHLSLDERHCVITVEDDGHGFDGHPGPVDHYAERGRGVELMHALVDHVDFVATPRAGTVVHLEKKLVFETAQPPEPRDGGGGGEGGGGMS